MPKRKQPGYSPTKGQRVNAETRRYQMLELTKGGATERQIAEALGVDKSYVHREVKKVLEILAQTHSNTADTVRALQMERYIQLLSKWWSQAITGDEAATNMVLKIMSRIDQINGIIPDKPLIDMRTQTIQMGEGVGMTLHQMYMEAIKQNGGEPDKKPLLKEPSSNGVINGTYKATD
jgi:hypothetical protein